MKKRVAILTQKGSLSKGLQNNTAVNLFELDNDEVVGFQNMNVGEVNENHFSVMMWMKDVSLVYADFISSDLKNMLNDFGISSKSKDNFSDDKFIQHFIFK